MPVQIRRLRRWLAAAAIAAALVVGGVYFYARHRVQNALKQVPGRLAANIHQSAKGYTYSQSDQGRTIFKVQASRALVKLDGQTELQDVVITLYGRDAGRFDQIYGADFAYDPKSGDVTAKGEVQIDLEANPAGMTSPDQAAPKELKNPIHLKTSGLVFNQKTGDAHTDQKVDFRVSQASGSAVGVDYVSNTSILTLASQVTMVMSGAKGANITAEHGVITKDPRAVVLQRAHLQQGTRQGDADQATLFMNSDDVLQRVLGVGNVRLDLSGTQTTRVRANQLDLLLDPDGRYLRTATFSGNVEMNSPEKSAQGNAGRVVATFTGESVLQKVRAEENVKLEQAPQAVAQPLKVHSAKKRDLPAQASPAQTVALAAPAVDFFVADGRRLTHAETAGASQIDVKSAEAKSGQTRITAAKFTAQFDALGLLASLHGEPEARIVNSAPGQPDRVSTSLSLDASFAPGQGMETAVQQGNVVFNDGERQVWADRARYTPSNQLLELSGSPRVLDQNMTTTAKLVRLNRATGEGVAEGDVKTTYNGLKQQANGAMLASSSPIHVTAHQMTMYRDPATALYSDDARLWQDANVVTAPAILFDRNHRSIQASGSMAQPVSTVMVEARKPGQVSPVTITAGQLNYVDNSREALYTGGVTAKSTDLVVAATRMDVFLQPEDKAKKNPAGDAAKETANLDHIVAQGQVVVRQPNRRANGDQLVYTAVDQKFVLTGGPPSIFDAERGKITGVSLTLFRADDRVLVEGTDTSPSVTHTQVAR